MKTTSGQYHHVSDGDFDGLFEINRGIGRGGDQPRLVRQEKHSGIHRTAYSRVISHWSCF
ncbi:MAG: hypothetical protein P8M20_09565 [Planctomycetaceae bacterium]|nr:hypothetical protein [Planctomycetaceae bacterium]